MEFPPQSLPLVRSYKTFCRNCGAIGYTMNFRTRSVICKICFLTDIRAAVRRRNARMGFSEFMLVSLTNPIRTQFFKSELFDINLLYLIRRFQE
jgi:hypothetical protein